MWSVRLSDGGRFAVLLNQGPAAANITAEWKDLGLEAGASFHARDTWRHEDLGSFKGQFTAPGVAPKTSVAIRLTPVKSPSR